jgi:histidinol-phosphate aminotransferase
MSVESVIDGAASRLARTPVLALEPYVWEMTNLEVAERYGVDSSRVVRFDTNTSPLPPASLSHAMREIEAAPVVNEYYDSTYVVLTRAIGEYIALSPEHLVVGAGADEVLDIICKTFVDPGDPVVIPQPTYAMYRILAQGMGAGVRSVPMSHDLRFDADAIIAASAGAKLVFLCNPNNPTGMGLPAAQVERIASEVDCMLVVDEAYAEFWGESVLPSLHRHPRLIVVRTFSKAFCLAGARVGYAACSPEVAGLLNRVRPPQSVSCMSVVLAEKAVRDVAGMRANVDALLRERNWLSAALEGLGLTMYPSDTNFVLARVSSARIVARMQTACLQAGMVLRTFAAGSPLESCARITARSHEDNERLISTLRAAL